MIALKKTLRAAFGPCLCLALALAAKQSLAAAPKLDVVQRLVNTRNIRDITETTSGVWLATTGGLLHVENGTLKYYGNADGLPPGALHALLAEDDGSFWVAGDGGAVRVRWDHGRLAVERRVRVRGVRAMTKFRGDLYWATWGKGLLRTGPMDSVAKPVPQAQRDPWQTLTDVVVANGSLYVSTIGAGILVFDGHRVSSIRRGLASRLVWSLAFDGQYVWAATSRGIARISGKKVLKRRFAATRFDVGDLRAISIRGERIVVASFGGGVWEIDHSQGQLSRPKRIQGIPRRARVWSLFDAGTALFVGTADGLWTRQGNNVARLAIDGPLSNDISTIARAQTSLWVGTFDAGLSRYQNGTWRHFRLADGLVDDRINHLAIQNNGGKEIVWIGTPRGASRFIDGNWQSYVAGEPNGLAKGHVNGIQAVGPKVYFASSGGVSVFDGKLWQRFGADEGFPLRQATSLSMAADGGLWVGGLAGSARLNLADGRWTKRQTVANGDLPDNWVTALHSVGGNLWSGTYDGGVALLRKNQTPQIWREVDGLPCGWVNPQAMNHIGAYLWIGTMEGGLLAHKDGAWTRFGTKQGLPSNDITAIASGPQDEIWIASRAGLVRAQLR